MYLQQVLSDTIMIGYDPQPIKLCPATLTTYNLLLLGYQLNIVWVSDETDLCQLDYE